MTREGLLKQIQRKNEPYRRIKELEEENAQLKKDYEETETLLEKQIEATLKLDKENAELKEKLDIISKNSEPAGKALVDMVKREVKKAEQGKLAELKENLAYAKAVMRELLDNSSEYARQRAMDFLEAN